MQMHITNRRRPTDGGAAAMTRRLSRRAAARALVAFLALLWGAPLLFAGHLPSAPDAELEVEAFTRYFVDLDRFEPYLELAGRWKNDGAAELDYQALRVGSYYRLMDNVKVGAFYRMKAGVRHDDDWVESGGGWEWRDAQSRYEHELIVDVSPRFLLEFLPGRSWVFMLKSRYMANASYGLHSVMLRPGLTYFWMRGREPLLNISAAYAFYIPLNFSDVPLYQQWPYLELLYHASERIKLDARISRRSITWTDSKDFRELFPNESYELSYKPFSLGLGVIFTIEP